MMNLVLAITMECVYQSIIRDLRLKETQMSRAQIYMIARFGELCFLCLADPEAASKRLFP